MTYWPVILRELRAESRLPANYFLRIAGASAATLCFGLLMLDGVRGSTAALGTRLFYALNLVQFCTIILVVPILTADCISKERREGTLGLLMLTPLTPLGIVLGKWLTQAVRGVSLIASMLPVLALPHILGGVGRQDMLMALLVNTSALLLALGAGIVASAFSRDWIRSIVLALVLCGLAIWAFMTLEWLAFSVLQFVHSGNGRRFIPGAPMFPPLEWAWDQWTSVPIFAQFRAMVGLSTGFEFETPWGFGFDFGWSRIWALSSPAFLRNWFAFTGWLTAGCAGVLAFALWLAAARIRNSWRETPPNALASWTYDKLCTPRFWKRIFHGNLRRTLNRNPIGWLHQFSVGARLTKWGWCLAALGVECLLVLDPIFDGLVTGQYVLAAVLLGALAFNASSSFHQEVESGAFELLLVTPLRESQIIWGRLRGVWAQFLPSIGLLLFVFGSLESKLGGWIGNYDRDLPLCFIPAVVCGFACVPIIGLRVSMLPGFRWADWLPFASGFRWHSVRVKKDAGAGDAQQVEGRGREGKSLANWSVCCLIALVLPYAIALGCADRSLGPRANSMPNQLVAIAVVVQIVIAVIAMRRLYRSLAQREFILH